MKEIPNQELKLNLRSSVTTMFNLIEIKMVSIFFSRVLNVVIVLITRLVTCIRKKDRTDRQTVYQNFNQQKWQR